MRAVEYVLYMVILMFFMFLMPDMIQYAKVAHKANQIADLAVERMAIEGGGSSDINDLIIDELERHNLKTDWDIDYTNERVGAPNPVRVSLSRDYHIIAFHVFGKQIGQSMEELLTVPIKVEKTRASQVYMRGEG